MLPLSAGLDTILDRNIPAQQFTGTANQPLALQDSGITIIDNTCDTREPLLADKYDGRNEVSDQSEIMDQLNGAERLLQRPKQGKTRRESRPIYLFTLTKWEAEAG